MKKIDTFFIIPTIAINIRPEGNQILFLWLNTYFFKIDL